MATRHSIQPSILCLLALSACEIGFAPLGGDEGVGDDTGTSVGDEADTSDEDSTGPSDPDTTSEDSTSSDEGSGDSESGDEGSSGSESGGSEGSSDSQGETDTAAGLDTDTDTGAPEDQPSPEQLAEIDEMLSDLEAIVAGSLAYFDKAHDEEPLHRCPYIDGWLTGSQASFTPQNSLHCSEFPEGCVPVTEVDGEGEYDMALWLENPVWERAGWHRPEGVGHMFHYNLVTSNAGWGYGACDVTAMAWADFDGDFVFAHYSLSAHVDEQGVTIDPLVVENPYE